MHLVRIAALVVLGCGKSSTAEDPPKPKPAPKHVVDVACASGTAQKRQPWRQQVSHGDTYTEGEQAWCERTDGTRHGPLRINYMSGPRAVEGEYRDGARVGTWTSWYGDGPKAAEEVWVDGHREGAWRSFRPEGRPWAAATFKADKLDGTWIEFGEDGRRAVVGRFVDGKPSGDFVRTAPDGTTTTFAPDPAKYDPTPIGE